MPAAPDPEKPITFWSAVSLGVGAMIGAGIFALLGEAGTIAGNAVYLSFIAGGLIAMLSGYSLGKLGARFPSAGGIVEYLVQCYGVGLFSGTMSIVLYVAAVVSLALIAKTFGNYAATFLPATVGPHAHHVLAIGIVAAFVGVNLRGPRDVAFWEKLTVAIKFSVLLVLAIAGLVSLQPELLSPRSYPAPNDVLFSLAITFFAYEGFRVITNAAEDMPDPAHTLPRAILTAIALVMALYVAVSLAVFGQLTADRVVEARDYALAEAALPIFGPIGFRVLAVAALVSTASAINANLYAVTNVTYELATKGELPAAFGRPIAHSREGLVISGLFVMILALGFDLSQIAAIGSIAILFVHGVTHLGHLRRIDETGASRALVATAALTSFGAMGIALLYLSREAPSVIALLGLLGASALALELALQRLRGREVRGRVPR
ncbi:MAG: APC family permease [Myxococcota bacterium]